MPFGRAKSTALRQRLRFYHLSNASCRSSRKDTVPGLEVGYTTTTLSLATTSCGKIKHGAHFPSMKKLVLFFFASLLFFCCSTDLDINAPYKNITVIYGLLNQRDSVQFVKINKAFLGEGDAYVFSQIRDSSEFNSEDLTVKMVYKVVNGDRVASFPLLDSVVTNREPGLFYGPEQTVYYFVDPTMYDPIEGKPVYLDQNAEYEIEVVAKGEKMTSRTTIVNNFDIQSVDAEINSEMTVMSFNGQSYGAFELNWDAGIDGKRYEARWRFNFDEYRNGVAEARSVTRNLARQTSTNSSSTADDFAVFISGEDFFGAIANDVPVDPAVEKRVFTGVDFLFTVANDDFNTFLTLSEPISGIVEDRPAWSNIENGYGIWASRFTKNVGQYRVGKKLNGYSLNELVNGNLTGNRMFCNDMIDQNTSYDCP